MAGGTLASFGKIVMNSRKVLSKLELNSAQRK
jgi:hypothetical protein